MCIRDRLPIRTAQRRRITDWPLLLLRALAIVLLVLAFARPLWSRPGVTRASAGDRTVIVLLDRSMSMGHTGVWQRAVNEARNAIAGLSATDRVALVLFDEEAEIAQPLTTDRNLAIAALAKAKPGTAGTRYAAGLRAARQIATDARTGMAPVDVVLVTDMQRSGLAGLAGLEIPATMRVRATRRHGERDVARRGPGPADDGDAAAQRPAERHAGADGERDGRHEG